MPSPSRDTSIHLRAEGYAHLLLSKLRRSPEAAVDVLVTSTTAAVRITITPPDEAGRQLPGDHFSPLERLIYDAVTAALVKSPGKPVKGNTIARMIGTPPDAKLKYTLAGLVDRRALRRTGRGYLLPSQRGEGRAP